jgi:predicted nucleic acid-binding protein
VIDVVLDTNVLVAAFRSNLGASYRLLQTLETRQWRPVVSPTLALEYESVLKRPDPDDDCILELAIRAGAPIVTFNVKHFRGAKAFGVEIMMPRELLASIGDQRCT